MAKPVPKPLVNLMLDSGVFSAFQKGEIVDIKAYGKFCQKWHDLLFSYVSMDVIPGGKPRPGESNAERLMRLEKERTPEMLEEAAKQSYKNHQFLKKMGLSPIPVFHQGENKKWLLKYLEDGDPYVGLSAVKSNWSARGSHDAWFEDVWPLIPKGVKVHGFGVTGVRFLTRYPWYSTDSTTWSKGAGYGKIFVPQYTLKNGKPDKPVWTKFYQYTLSTVGRMEGGAALWRGSARGYIDAHNYAGDEEGLIRQVVEKFLEEECGTTLGDCRHTADARRRAMLVYYKKLTESLGIRLMFATTINNKNWGILMNDVGATNRLLSYYELRNSPDDVIRDFIMKGTHGTHRALPRKMDWTNESYLNWRRLRLLEIGKGGKKQKYELDACCIMGDKNAKARAA